MSLLKWALIVLVLAGVAALFGFGGIAEGLTDIAQILFGVFVVVVLVLVVLGLTVYKAAT